MNNPEIDLYTWSTPNGRKVSIMLEEIGLEYRVNKVDITQGKQFGKRFSAISPNNKIPAILDHKEKISLMESGAILLYLANKTGKLISPIGPRYWQEIEWLMFQMGGVGPMLGQTHHFLKFNPGKSSYAEERYFTETQRLYRVLNERLRKRKYLCEDYSIADIATWPWISRYEWQQIDLKEYPYLLDWYMRLAERPAVQRGYSVPTPLTVPMPR